MEAESKELESKRLVSDANSLGTQTPSVLAVFLCRLALAFQFLLLYFNFALPESWLWQIILPFLRTPSPDFNSRAWVAQWFQQNDLIGSVISKEGLDWLSNFDRRAWLAQLSSGTCLDGIVWRAIGSCRFQFQLSWTISSIWTLGSHLRSERLAPQPTTTISFHQNLSRLLFSAVSVCFCPSINRLCCFPHFRHTLECSLNVFVPFSSPTLAVSTLV